MLADTSRHHWGDTKTVTAVLLQGMREVLKFITWKHKSETILLLKHWFSQVPPTTFSMGFMYSGVTWATGHLSEEAEGSEQSSPGGRWLCVDGASLQEGQSQAYRAERGMLDGREGRRGWIQEKMNFGPAELKIFCYLYELACKCYCSPSHISFFC